MRKAKDELLAEIDATLDQLISNAEAAGGPAFQILDKNEIEALHKTQESLCARLLHREELLKNSTAHTKQLQKKVAHFTRLNERLMREMASRFKSPKANKPMRLRKSRLKAPVGLRQGHKGP